MGKSSWEIAVSGRLHGVVTEQLRRIPPVHGGKW